MAAGGRARLSLCHRSWRPTGWHLVVRSSTSLWRRWWNSVRSNVLRRPANRFSAGAGAVPSWAGRLRAPSFPAPVRKVEALPALNELEDAWLPIWLAARPRPRPCLGRGLPAMALTGERRTLRQLGQALPYWTLRADSNAPCELPNIFLTALARSAQWTGVYACFLDAIVRNGIVTIMAIMLVHVRAHTRSPTDDVCYTM